MYTVPIDGGVPVRQTFEGGATGGLDADGRRALHNATILDPSQYATRSRQSIDRRPNRRPARSG